MKTLRTSLTIAASVAALTTAFAQQQAQPEDSPQPAAAAQPVQTEPAAAPPVERVVSETEKGLQFNFRGASLDTVLKYMSEAAGFVIIPEVRVEGRVDVWSYQPVTKDEAVDLLNTVLNKNGYAAIRDDKVLTITTVENARRRNIPVKTIKVADAPSIIPKNDEMVTQIIQVRYANALQLTKDLTPLMAENATLTANESGNALVLTDTQKNIRRMTEIVRALDTSISSISAIRVFPLMHADAKELATVVKDLFEPPASGGRGGNNAQRGFQIGGRGGRGGGGFPGILLGGGGGDQGGGGGPQNTGVSEARQAASRVVAVADERTNSLVVSAPDEYISTIEDLVEKIDQAVDDVTELQVFHLKNSSPVEMADELMQLFPDETQSRNGQSGFGGGFQGFGGFGGRGGRGGGNQQNSSERSKKMGKVTAVPDERTGSLIVSASSQLMPQIAHMIEQLDSDPARKQQVFVYSLENADADKVAMILQEMFQSQNNRNLQNSSRNNTQNSNPLNNRNQFNQGTGGGGNTGGGFGQRN
ncbi:MAG: hypothetical protein O2960_11260 [Verrucomicrobia bacterium]|nr:hypothetical protein [Verrucomicrobiota bacterium]